MASRILGMGDVLSLIEDAQKNVDVEEAQKLAKKVKSGKGFDLEDFKAQIGQMRKMGGIAGMMDKLPAELARAGAGRGRRRAARSARIEGIINSMTPAERAKPETPQGVAQAADRGRRRRLGAGGQPAAQPVRADAEDDEDGRQGRHAEDDARHEGDAARPALTGRGARAAEPGRARPVRGAGGQTCGNAFFVV